VNWRIPDPGFTANTLSFKWLAIGKSYEAGAGPSRLSRLENEVLGTEAGLKALENVLMRSNDALVRSKRKQHLIVDMDSTEDPAHGNQENVRFNGHFGKNCFHQRRVLLGGEAEAGQSLSSGWLSVLPRSDCEAVPVPIRPRLASRGCGVC
jgi:Transposase DDE domain group 1